MTEMNMQDLHGGGTKMTPIATLEKNESNDANLNSIVFNFVRYRTTYFGKRRRERERGSNFLMIPSEPICVGLLSSDRVDEIFIFGPVVLEGTGSII